MIKQNDINCDKTMKFTKEGSAVKTKEKIYRSFGSCMPHVTYW
jgi:hypothetical protein